MGAIDNESEHIKTLSTAPTNRSQRFSDFSCFFLPMWSSQNVEDLPIFNYFFFFENSKFTIVPYGETKNLNYLENERS